MPVTFQFRAEDNINFRSPWVTVLSGEQVLKQSSNSSPWNAATGSFSFTQTSGARGLVWDCPARLQPAERSAVQWQKSPPSSCAPEISLIRKCPILKLGTVVENKALWKCSSFQTLIIIFLPKLFDPLTKAKWEAAENKQRPGKRMLLSPWPS